MASVLSKLYHHLRGVLLVTPWAAVLLIQDLLLSLILLLRPLSPSLAYHLSSPIAYSCWAWIQLIFERINGARIVISGDTLPEGESAVVISNHVGWSDFYMIQALAMRCKMLGYCRYFAKAQLKKVPLLGWGLMAMGMPLVTRNWQHDRRELDRVFHGITHARFPTWLISFSEATRFTPQKHKESQTWCTANNRPQPRHLLYPRTKGFVATVTHIRQTPHVRAVYDLTIAYQRGREWQAAPAFWDTLSVPRLSEGRAGYRFEVHVRRWPMEELPRDEEELVRWIEQRWVEKGQWLEQKRVAWAAEEEEEAERKKGQ
ncbi:hypothetical protein M406DRAFT_95986 [Cryphonectria parasitica EP155]|uniref:Phospholipid/glycerol acyltransferase domain-containing protein n=1 Tax=Cryphonectria parasitica (strain ATCC 38755 / EP155) TaxID=660469 RepID=A0A9P4YA60_CRYP1|nr:uncharacterized protein M406DRAFT_95986 [Cryphonectria parasitica EP155]KAF3769301.1 hypothetical protein M406DRAFT_95986 [Cryphonectria parasitica EP155]